MNHSPIYSKSQKALSQVFVFLICLTFLAGCKKNNSIEINEPLAGGYSILVQHDEVLVSGFKSLNGTVSSKFWINGQNSDQTTFEAHLENQSSYRQAINEHFRRVFIYKNSNGALQTYQFDQGSLQEKGKIFYYKDDAMVSMDSDSIGNISVVDFHEGDPYFAGFLGKVTASETGDVLRPLTPFVWDGQSSMALLSLPAQTVWFQGISTIYVDSPDEIYAGGLCGVPMYWKNNETVVLDQRYGEVWQITKSGSDVYAVGLVNKYDSNSTGHTACYWKNGELHELEDDAQAFGIVIDGDDIYIAGAIGNVPASYKPCYWKNGVRVDLPI